MAICNSLGISDSACSTVPINNVRSNYSSVDLSWVISSFSSADTESLKLNLNQKHPLPRLSPSDGLVKFHAGYIDYRDVVSMLLAPPQS